MVEEAKKHPWWMDGGGGGSCEGSFLYQLFIPSKVACLRAEQ